MKANLHRLASTMGKQVSEVSLHQRPVARIVLASKCGSRVLLLIKIKAFKNWTLCDWTAAFAGVRQLPQGPFHGIKASNLCVYVSNLQLAFGHLCFLRSQTLVAITVPESPQAKTQVPVRVE